VDSVLAWWTSIWETNSTSKDLKLLIIGIHPGFHLFYGDYHMFQHLFHFCRLMILSTSAVFNSITPSIQSHFWHQLSCEGVTIDRGWIGNWLHWTLTDRNYK
jgi:hypothetical protein